MHRWPDLFHPLPASYFLLLSPFNTSMVPFCPPIFFVRSNVHESRPTRSLEATKIRRELQSPKAHRVSTCIRSTSKHESSLAFGRSPSHWANGSYPVVQVAPRKKRAVLDVSASIELLTFFGFGTRLDRRHGTGSYRSLRHRTSFKEW